MLEEIALRFHTELKGVPCIGDSLRDLQAAEAVGAQPILVLTGKGKKTQAEGAAAAQDARVRRPRGGRAPPDRSARMTALRSALFLVLAVLVITSPFGILVPLGGLFGYRAGVRGRAASTRACVI